MNEIKPNDELQFLSLLGLVVDVVVYMVSVYSAHSAVPLLVTFPVAVMFFTMVVFSENN